MTPKKTAKVEPKFDPPVIPEGAIDWAAIPEPRETTEELIETANQALAQPRHGFFAYAPFDVDGAHYEKGDEFTPPAGWTRDAAFDEFRSIERKNSAHPGIAFIVPGEILDKKTKERAYSREVLPLTEA